MMMKSITYFNTQFKEQGLNAYLDDETWEPYKLKVGKKKNGRPNSDYPGIQHLLIF